MDKESNSKATDNLNNQDINNTVGLLWSINNLAEFIQYTHLTHGKTHWREEHINNMISRACDSIGRISKEIENTLRKRQCETL